MVYTKNRIKPEEVVEAFKSTGLTPERGNYFSHGCACGLGAVYAAKHITLNKVYNADDDLIISHDLDDEYGISYRIGFVNGFDGSPHVFDVQQFSRQKYVEEEYRAGYEDGKAAYELSIQSIH